MTFVQFVGLFQFNVAITPENRKVLIGRRHSWGHFASIHFDSRHLLNWLEQLACFLHVG